MTILERIQQLKMQRGWTEYRLAEESGIPQSTISSWYRKNINPSIGSLEAICAAFQITLSQFFSWEDEGAPVQLTQNQRRLMDSFSRLAPPQQKTLLEFLQSLHPEEDPL